MITGYETRLDATQLGLGVTAFVHVSMEKGHMANLRKFTDAIRALPEVLECFSVTGDFDYVLKVMARDLKALSKFLMDTLMALPSVDNVRSGRLTVDKCVAANPAVAAELRGPLEVAAGMAFPADYIWGGTRRERVKLCGNAVTPPAARDLVAAVAESLR